jgi:hypothetical protein
MNPQRRQSRFASQEETIDVESAVKQLIARLLDTSSGKTTPAAIREHIDSILESLSPASGRRDPLQPAAPRGAPAHTTFALLRRRGDLLENLLLLSPDTLAAEIVPLLNALIAIQSPAPAGAPAIVELVQGPPLHITMSGIAEAVTLTTQIVVPWRAANFEKITRAADSSDQVVFQHQTSERAKVEIATAILQRLRPGLPDAEKLPLLARLLPPVHLLMYGGLEISLP